MWKAYMDLPVLPIVDLQTGRVLLLHGNESLERICLQPHQLVDALQRSVRRPRLSAGNKLLIAVATTGYRSGLELEFPLLAVSGAAGRKLRAAETLTAGNPAKKTEKMALQ